MYEPGSRNNTKDVPGATRSGARVQLLRRPGRGHWLLARRNMSTGELAYYVCYGPR
jgi:hypothetical protein